MMNDALFERTLAEPLTQRGTNQSGMRARNERLFLSLLRQNGALAKSDLARMTGLSAQTVSVIMRELEQDGFLVKGEPLRGRIGQPSVPISLNPDGAYFLGLKVGRRSSDLTLIDFLGGVRASERLVYPYPTAGGVLDFVAEAMGKILSALPPDRRGRVGGMGVAMPFRMWDWVQTIGAPQAAMEDWRDRNIQAELEAITGGQVYIQNDASSACGAELLFGTGERPANFLYYYVGTFIGGGLVIGGQLFLGATGNAAGVGSMPIGTVTGQRKSLIGAASLQVLADRMIAAGEVPDNMWRQAESWTVSERLLNNWLDDAAAGLAWTSLSAAALLELDAIVIDGWMPAYIRRELTARVARAMSHLDSAGIVVPQVRPGTVGAFARSLGAAAIPLSKRYLVDQAGA